MRESLRHRSTHQRLDDHRALLRRLSHDLKSPISAIQLLLNLSEDGGDLRTDSMRRSLMRIILLVDTAMEWARIESGRAGRQIVPLDLGELAASVVAELGPIAGRRDVELRCASPRPVKISTDRRVVRLLLLNIVADVVHSTRGRRVEVTVERTRSGADIVAKESAPALVESEHAYGLGAGVIEDIADFLHGRIRRQSDDAESVHVLSLPTET